MSTTFRPYPPDHLPGGDVEGRIQIRGLVSLMVVRPALDLRGTRGQQRMGPVKGLDLRLLGDREHQRVVGRVEVEPDDVDDLLGEWRPSASRLARPRRQGWACSRHATALLGQRVAGGAGEPAAGEGLGAGFLLVNRTHVRPAQSVCGSLESS